MTNITAGEAAIARLDTAVDAFEHILTGAEGEVIGVPNHPPQPTLATRVKTSLDALTQSPAQSAAEAAGYAEEAAESLAAAQKLTSVPFEDAPFPDVWAPLNDNLILLAGFAPADTITVAGTSYSLPTKSMTFTRSTTATYIDKSGVLRTAAINEPRFERNGILMEGASVNYFLNSEDPTKWSNNGTITKATITDGTTQAVTCQGTINTDTPSAQLHASSNITVVTGDTVTLSARAKSTLGRLRFRFTLDGTQVAEALFDAVTGAFISSTAGLIFTTSLNPSDGYSYISVTFSAAASGNVSGNIWFSSASGNLAVGSVVNYQTIQCEKNSIATSYIPTGASAATRATDALSLQPSCNIGYRLVGDQFNRTTSFDVTVDKYGMPAAGYFELLEATGANYDKFIRAHPLRIEAFRSSSSLTIPITYPLATTKYVQTIDSLNVMSLYLGDAIASKTVLANQPTTAPAQIKFGTSASCVYHIRNFRIWHRKLTLNQINGLR